MRLRSPQAVTPEAVYFPLGQQGGRHLTLIVRTEAGAHECFSVVRERMRQIDPELPLLRMLALHDTLQANLGGLRIMEGLLGTAGAVALGLAALGLYSVVA